MKYIKNNGRYAIAFPIVKNGREVKIELDRRRVYLDTGNIATSGITAVADEDVEELKKIKRFNQMFESKELEFTDVTKIENTEKKVKDLEKENAELKKKLEAKPADTKKVKDLEKENADLKKKLEALCADKADTEKETEGF